MVPGKELLSKLLFLGYAHLHNITVAKTTFTFNGIEKKHLGGESRPSLCLCTGILRLDFGLAWQI